MDELIEGRRFAGWRLVNRRLRVVVGRAIVGQVYGPLWSDWSVYGKEHGSVRAAGAVREGDIA